MSAGGPVEPKAYLENEVLWDQVLSRLSVFQKLIFVRIISPDKLIQCLQSLIVQEMGQEFIKVPAFNLDQAYADSQNKKPIIFILKSGVDPYEQIVTFSEKYLESKEKFLIVSLG